MILEELVVHDFGVYRGRHVVNLTPDSSTKPVVLIGARNGRGKTTLLDAVNLVLFGSRARLSNRGTLSWEEYLRRSINRGATGGAGVTLQFVVEDPFEPRRYQVTRQWVVSGKSLREYFDVHLNGRLDRVLAQDWNDHIEGMLPLDVASLHFFDGEKIDQLADPAQSRSVIAAAVRGLLGLGVLERLEGDLKVLLRRKQDQLIGDDASEELRQLDEEIEVMGQRRAAGALESAQLRSAVERQTEVVRRLEDSARELGADKWERRQELTTAGMELRAEISALEQSLHSMAAGVAPLRLLGPLAARAADQMRRDALTHRARLVLEVLEERDRRILERGGEFVDQALAGMLSDDRHGWSVAASATMVHADPTGSETMLAAAQAEIDELGALDHLLDELGALESRLTDVDRALLAVPSDEQLGEVLQELGAARQRLEGQLLQLTAAQEEFTHIGTSIERLEARASRLRDEEADLRKAALDDQRVREYAQRALGTLAKVSTETLDRNLGLMEAAILKRFGELIGKQALVTAIRIDKETLELLVTTGDGAELPIDRLSAGERQLLATATVWGLSSVAGRSIPLVIDTPLSRLDREHRRHLVTNYFPNAAEQVIILSTDSEIDDELYELLSPFVSREYLITFSDDLDSSEIVDGYFTGDQNAN